MAISTLRADSAQANPDFRTRMMAHDVNGVMQLYDGPADATIKITRHLHALALMLEAAFRKDDVSKVAAADDLNPQIVEGAFAALADMAALANFFATEAATNPSR